jgi:hypothetical protein
VDVEKIAIFIPFVALLIPIIAIIMGSIEKTNKTKAREESRREIAAYVAEGSISPDEAIRLMEAGEKIKKT